DLLRAADDLQASLLFERIELVGSQTFQAAGVGGKLYRKTSRRVPRPVTANAIYTRSVGQPHTQLSLARPDLLPLASRRKQLIAACRGSRPTGQRYGLPG